MNKTHRITVCEEQARGYFRHGGSDKTSLALHFFEQHPDLNLAEIKAAVYRAWQAVADEKERGE